MGGRSQALYQSWAVMEWKSGDVATVPYLFEMALRLHPTSRYTLLAFAMFQKERGQLKECIELLERGIAANPTDPALFQARFHK